MINYYTFAKYMDIARQDTEYMEKVSDITKSDFLFENIQSPGAILDLLAAIFQDKDDWIGYYVYGLNWGKDYSPERVQMETGECVTLSTYEDLFNLLSESVSQSK